MIPYLNLTPNQAYQYAYYVIKERFPEAEPVIAGDKFYRERYNELMKKAGIDFRLTLNK